MNLSNRTTILQLLAISSVLIALSASPANSQDYPISGVKAPDLLSTCIKDGVALKQYPGEGLADFSRRCGGAGPGDSMRGNADTSYEKTKVIFELLNNINKRPSTGNDAQPPPSSQQSTIDTYVDDNPFADLQSDYCVELQNYKRARLEKDLNYAIQIERSIPDAIDLFKELEVDVNYYKDSVEFADGLKLFLQSTKLTTNLMLNIMKVMPGEGAVADYIKGGSDALGDRELVGKLAEALSNQSSISEVSRILTETLVKIYKGKIGKGGVDKFNLFYNLAKDLSGISQTVKANEGAKNKQELIKRATEVREKLEQLKNQLNAAKDTIRRLSLLSKKIDSTCPLRSNNNPGSSTNKLPKSDTDIFLP